MSKNEQLKELAKPLVEFIKENYHPHTTIIIDVQHAEVLEGVAVAKFYSDDEREFNKEECDWRYNASCVADANCADECDMKCPYKKNEK